MSQPSGSVPSWSLFHMFRNIDPNLFRGTSFLPGIRPGVKVASPARPERASLSTGGLMLTLNRSIAERLDDILRPKSPETPTQPWSAAVRPDAGEVAKNLRNWPSRRFGQTANEKGATTKATSGQVQSAPARGAQSARSQSAPSASAAEGAAPQSNKTIRSGGAAEGAAPQSGRTMRSGNMAEGAAPQASILSQPAPQRSRPSLPGALAPQVSPRNNQPWVNIFKVQPQPAQPVPGKPTGGANILTQPPVLPSTRGNHQRGPDTTMGPLVTPQHQPAHSPFRIPLAPLVNLGHEMGALLPGSRPPQPPPPKVDSPLPQPPAVVTLDPGTGTAPGEIPGEPGPTGVTQQGAKTTTPPGTGSRGPTGTSSRTQTPVEVSEKFRSNAFLQFRSLPGGLEQYLIPPDLQSIFESAGFLRMSGLFGRATGSGPIDIDARLFQAGIQLSGSPETELLGKQFETSGGRLERVATTAAGLAGAAEVRRKDETAERSDSGDGFEPAAEESAAGAASRPASTTSRSRAGLAGEGAKVERTRAAAEVHLFERDTAQTDQPGTRTVRVPGQSDPRFEGPAAPSRPRSTTRARGEEDVRPTAGELQESSSVLGAAQASQAVPMAFGITDRTGARAEKAGRSAMGHSTADGRIIEGIESPRESHTRRESGQQGREETGGQGSREQRFDPPSRSTTARGGAEQGPNLASVAREAALRDSASRQAARAGLETAALDTSPQRLFERNLEAPQHAATAIAALLKKSARDKDEDDLSGVQAAEQLIEMVLNARSEHTYEHSDRVVGLAMDLAGKLGITDQARLESIRNGTIYRDVGELELELIPRPGGDTGDLVEDFLTGADLAKAGKLHDIGKIRIPSEILNKEGKLTEEEYEIIKQHPLIGVELVKPIPSLQSAIPSIRHHHERWDGRGYPWGLKGDEIPTEARIVGLVDFFDALVADRPYRKGMDLEQVKELILEGRGTHFEPKLVDEFMTIVDQEYEKRYRMKSILVEQDF